MVEAKNVENVPVLQILEGKVTAAVIADFKKALDENLDTTKATVLDMNQVEFMDSSGLGALIACCKRMELNTDLAVCNLSSNVQEIFEITRMNRVFKVYDSLAEAVGTYSQG